MLASTMQSRCESGKDQARDTARCKERVQLFPQPCLYWRWCVPSHTVNKPLYFPNHCHPGEVRAAGVAVTPFLSILGCLISRCSQDIRNRNVSFSNLKFCTQKSFCLLRAKWAFQVQLGGKILMYTLVLSPCHWLHDLKLELEMKAFFRVAGSSVQTKLEKIRAIMENLP